MKLNQELLEPILKGTGFTATTPKTYVMTYEERRYLVDFKTDQVCRTDGPYFDKRVEEDNEDEFLCSLIRTIMEAMGGVGKEQEVLPPEDETPLPPACNSPVATKQSLPTLSNANIVRPAISAHDAKLAWTEYLDMRNTILEKSDFQKIQGKDFIKKSGWRKFATFYNLTDTIAEENRIAVDGNEFIWKIKVICTAPNGRTTEGVAMCSSKEKNGTRIEHDVYSTAHTRAKNRSISDMIAAGEVSAEEVEA